MSPSQIQLFYKDKVVLLTGGTGYLGMALIEKLLRSCPDIGKIYLLIREKRGCSSQDRLKQLIDNVVFSRLKNEQPKFSEKLDVIQGNLIEPNLGLSQNDKALLINVTDIVLHSGATVSFNKLKSAIETNVVATRELCRISQEMVKLKAFVYVSSAYTYAENTFIPEKVPPPVIPPDNVIALADLLDEHRLENISAK